MLGQLTLARGGRGRAEAGSLYGLPVLRARADPEGFWGERRLKKACLGLRRGGVLRVLAPKRFGGWPVLAALGLRPVETEDFVRSQSAPLALACLERQGVAPDRAAVALRGLRADRAMARTARLLCPRVRELIIDAPSGGGELAAWLRREFGIPVLPPGERGQVALRFHPAGGSGEETALALYGPVPDLGTLRLAAPGLAREDREDLPLLSALWERGKLGPEDIKILDRTAGSTYNVKESIFIPIDPLKTD